MKNGGIAEFGAYPEVHDALLSIVNKCHALGLFLAPVGQLEYWSPGLEVQASKSKKAEWSNEASLRIREHPELASDLLDFMRSIGEFHISEGMRCLA